MTVASDLSRPADGLSKRLKSDTSSLHEELDAAITARRPFASLGLYGRFLNVQRAFHRDIDALYGDPALIRLVPDLPALRRLPSIVRDMADLDLPIEADAEAPVFAEGEAHDLAGALGWLYVVEGSNLGAAFLLKQAATLGLSENFGARHLAPAANGRGPTWRSFVAALDAAPLDVSGKARAASGARAAFRRVQGLVANAF